MSAVDTITAVLGTKLLRPDLMIIPSRGATEDEIHEEQSILRGSFCDDHIAILRHWNGISLEVVRLFGCGRLTGEVGRLADFQIAVDACPDGAIVVGTDASGFLYFQARDRRLYCFDTDGGQLQQLAESLDDFIDRVVFGPDAVSFGGEEWFRELRSAGIV